MYKRLAISLILAVSLAGLAQAKSSMRHPNTDVYKGWRVGTQTYSFNRFTLFEAIDKTRALGLNWIQAYTGQIVSKDIKVKVNHQLSPKHRQQIKDKLDKTNIGIFSYFAIGVLKDQKQARALFSFAKDMGIGTLVFEPDPAQLDMIEKLCTEYKIKFAIHNHAKPHRYWNPDTVLEVCKNRSKLIGACADPGHWIRSGLDPVKCLKKLEGRIIDVHIKEVDNGKNMIFGTGNTKIKEILQELHRQKYQGTFSIEYESNFSNNVPDIRESLIYFDSIASKLNPTGWTALFDKDLSNATFKKGSWVVNNGQLVRKGKGDIWTEGKYSDFLLDFEFKLAKNTNSGIFIRAGKQCWTPWIEVQIEDSHGKPISKHICGGIFDIQEPTVNAVKPAGQWNKMTIFAKDARLCVMLNSQLVVNMDLNQWTEPNKNPDGSKNKFNIAYKDLPRTGWIGFQDHGQDVSYRNIKILEIK